MTDSAVSMMLMLAAASVLPFILAAGTCYLKFSIVFVMVRNALGFSRCRQIWYSMRLRLFWRWW